MISDFIKNSDAPEDLILGAAPDKIQRLLDDPSYRLFKPLATHLDNNEFPYDLGSFLFAGATLVTGASAETNKLVLFTSDRRHEAENFVLENPDHDLIHTTPMGYYLEKLRLFEERSFGKLGAGPSYLFWNMAAAKLIAQTTSEHIKIFANKDNQTSTLWMLETPALAHNPLPQSFELIDGSNTEHHDRESILQFARPGLLEWNTLLSNYLGAAPANDTQQARRLKDHFMSAKYKLDGSLASSIQDPAFKELASHYLVIMEMFFSNSSQKLPFNEKPDSLAAYL